MKKIELPALWVPCMYPIAAPKALALFVDYWRVHKQPFGLVIGESLPDAENKCEDIAALRGFLPWMQS